MIKFLSVIILILMGAVAWLYYKQPITLFDRVALEAIECPGMSGTGAVIMGVGGNKGATPDPECNERANAQLMLATGMPDNARMGACQTATSLRQYANVDNCMNAADYGYVKIMADVNAKYQGCRAELGRPRWYRPVRKSRFKKCMGRLV